MRHSCGSLLGGGEVVVIVFFFGCEIRSRLRAKNLYVEGWAWGVKLGEMVHILLLLSSIFQCAKCGVQMISKKAC